MWFFVINQTDSEPAVEPMEFGNEEIILHPNPTLLYAIPPYKVEVKKTHFSEYDNDGMLHCFLVLKSNHTNFLAQNSFLYALPPSLLMDEHYSEPIEHFELSYDGNIYFF